MRRFFMQVVPQAQLGGYDTDHREYIDGIDSRSPRLDVIQQVQRTSAFLLDFPGLERPSSVIDVFRDSADVAVSLNKDDHDGDGI